MLDQRARGRTSSASMMCSRAFSSGVESNRCGTYDNVSPENVMELIYFIINAVSLTVGAVVAVAVGEGVVGAAGDGSAIAVLLEPCPEPIVSYHSGRDDKCSFESSSHKCS